MRMNFATELYRLREEDGEHSTLDWVSLEALDLKATVDVAGSFFYTFAMPQIPDRFCDRAGRELYAAPHSSCSVVNCSV